MKYILLAGIFIALGAGLFFMPEQSHDKALDPEMVLQELADQSRFISVDEVADRIIKQDPALLLIDLRSEAEYRKFTLPGALNIPLDKLLEEGAPYFNRDEYNLVFFGNGDVIAEQAWMIARRQKSPHVQVMRGGLDAWARQVLDPPAPAPTASQEAFDRYQFRLAARQYFFGGSRAMDPAGYEPAAVTEPTRQKVIRPRKKQVEEEEGC